MSARGDREVIPNGNGDGLTFKELLIVAALFGGCDAQSAIREASQVLAALDGDKLPRMRVVRRGDEEEKPSPF